MGFEAVALGINILRNWGWSEWFQKTSPPPLPWAAPGILLIELHPWILSTDWWTLAERSHTKMWSALYQREWESGISLRDRCLRPSEKKQVLEESLRQKWENLKTGNEESRQVMDCPSGLDWGRLKLNKWRGHQAGEVGRSGQGWRPGLHLTSVILSRKGKIITVIVRQRGHCHWEHLYVEWTSLLLM